MLKFLSNFKKILLGGITIGLLIHKISIVSLMVVTFILIEVYQGLFILE